MVTPWGNKGVAWRKRWCEEQCQVHAGEEDHARPGWTTSRRGQYSLWKSQSEWQRTHINGESTSMVWPTLGSRTAKEQNTTSNRRHYVQTWCHKYSTCSPWPCRSRLQEVVPSIHYLSWAAMSCANMTSSVKLEICSISLCCHAKKIGEDGTCSYLWRYDHGETNTQTDRHAHHNTPLWGKSRNSWEQVSLKV